MPIANTQVVAVFSEIADLLEIESANPFRVRAYRNAARMLSELGHSFGSASLYFTGSKAHNIALPKLVKLSDLRGDLHVHTRGSDGGDQLEAMAEAARARGLQYLAITEHSKRLALVNGLDDDGLARQIDQIEETNARLKRIVLLKGVEVDILEDGSLDLPDTVLRRLDLVVGAIHSGFSLTRDKQTDRLLRAMDHPCFSLLAHPTGRLLNKRQPCDVDWPRVIKKAKERGCFLELNAHPERQGFGITQARRGWLEAGDVLNTRALSQLRPLLNATMSR